MGCRITECHGLCWGLPIYATPQVHSRRLCCFVSEFGKDAATISVTVRVNLPDTKTIARVMPITLRVEGHHCHNVTAIRGVLEVRDVGALPCPPALRKPQCRKCDVWSIGITLYICAVCAGAARHPSAWFLRVSRISGSLSG